MVAGGIGAAVMVAQGRQAYCGRDCERIIEDALSGDYFVDDLSAADFKL